jgi:transcription elongation factor S-II
MPQLSTVLLSIKGDVRRANIQLNDNSELTKEILQKYFKKKDEPEQICYYEYDNKIIFIFGYKKGKKGTENKVELVAPYSDITMYGDALVIVSQSHKWENPIHFTLDQWNTFYNGDNKITDNDDDDNDDSDSDDDDTEDIDDSVEDDNIDGFSDEDSVASTIIEEEEQEEIVAPVKKRRAPTYNKVDTSALKEEIEFTSPPESHKLRTLCLNSFQFLKGQFTDEDIRSLERSIFETAYNKAQNNYVARSWKSHIFIELYRQVIRSVMSNIHPESPVKNPRLLSRILDGEFKLNEIASMTSYELYPEKWFELKDKLLQREQKILEGNKSRATDQFKCRRCNKRECTYYELQTRSADEPMTIFVTCLNCGKEWRNGG